MQVENCKLQKVIAAKDLDITKANSKLESLRAEIDLLVLEKEELADSIEVQAASEEQISSLSQVTILEHSLCIYFSVPTMMIGSKTGQTSILQLIF